MQAIAAVLADPVMEGEDVESCSSSSGSEGQSPSRSRKFPPAVLASLNALFENGMVGVGKQYSFAIHRASLDTKLSTEQIKVFDHSECTSATSE